MNISVNFFVIILLFILYAMFSIISELKPKEIIYNVVSVVFKIIIYSLYFIVYFFNHIQGLFELIVNQKSLYLDLTDAIIGFLLIFVIIDIIDSIRELLDFKRKIKYEEILENLDQTKIKELDKLLEEYKFKNSKVFTNK